MGAILHILVHGSRHKVPLPPAASSGGINRMIHWLAVEQAAQGHKVYAMSQIGESNASYQHIRIPAQNSFETILEKIPNDVTDIEYHGGLAFDVVERLIERFPRTLQIIHGLENRVGKNRVYVSKSHAKHFGGEVFAYNGIPVDSYQFSEDKEDFLLFLAKVRRSKKGVATAINVAKKSKTKLIVAGGHRLSSPETWFPWHRLVKPVGYINGDEKFRLLSKAKALLVPIRWEEPFGLTIIEAMLSGTPVIAFNRGAMSELIIDGVTGFLCDNEEEMLSAINKIEQLSPQVCRAHVIKYFSSYAMYQKHQELLDSAGQGSHW